MTNSFADVETIIVDQLPSQEVALYVYVITHNPSDYPGKFVVRKQAAFKGALLIASEPTAVVDTLEEARAAIPGGLVCLARDVEDDPVIYESWF